MSKPSFTSHNGINVHSSQAVSTPKGMTHIFQKTPSVSSPAWGSQFNIQFKGKSLNLDELILEFNMSALTGLTVTNSGTAAYCSCFSWASRIDILIGSLVIDSIYPLQNFLYKQLFIGSDEKRTLMNQAAGDWNSHATRATKSASANTWYLPLYSVFDTSSVPILHPKDDIEIRVYMDSLANQFTLTSGSTATGTPASTILSCNLLTRHSQLPQDLVGHARALQGKASIHFPFLEVRQQQFTVTASGVSSSNLVLTAITGNVAMFVFAIRPTSATGSNQFTFSTLASFDLLDGGSSPLLGGQPITSDQSRLILGGRYTNTTYLNDAPAYLYSFSVDPQATYEKGVNLGSHPFKGNEQLVLRFASTLGSSVDVLVYALTHAALEMSNNHTKKIGL